MMRTSGWPVRSARTRARSCSPAGAPRPRTSRSRGLLGRVGRAGIGWSPRAVEHHATHHTLRHLEKFGFEVVEVGVDRYGRVDPDDIERALTDRTTLVSVILGNNEVGTLQPVAEIAERVQGAARDPAPRGRGAGGALD